MGIRVGPTDNTGMAVASSASLAGPEPETVTGLFATLESPLLGYALRLLSDADMAQDVVQEAFLRLHAQFEQVREPRRWLFRTVHNLALNQRRHDRRIVPLASGSTDAPTPAGDPPDPQPLPDEQLARWEGVNLVRQGLQNLDARSRELLTLKFNDDLSYKEISSRTGLTVGHVGYLLHHALKALAAELAKAGLVS
ncbi:MAG: RNA polymerase sigma factor [Verrucomicrobiales bacterium]|nr:RNA polymerase sigma factor [Verrucomicrobiales bacterium]